MRKNKILYYFINIVFIAVAFSFVNFNLLFHNDRLFQMFPLVVFLFLVIHFLRFVRMYLITLEELIRPSRFVQLYAKTVFVSSLIPFKIGELFKMYSYGVEMKKMAEGVVVVFIEKLFDAIVLCPIMLFAVWRGDHISSIVLVLVGFVILALIVFSAFGGMYSYLNNFLIRRGGGRKSLIVLKGLEGLKKIYDNIRQTVKGRFVLLFLLSIFAWMVEGVLLLVMDGGNFSLWVLVTYINDGFFGIANDNFSYYTCLCAVVFLVILLIVYSGKYYNILRKKGVYECLK